MLNDDYGPLNDHEEAILATLKEGGRMAPAHIREEVGDLHRNSIGHYLQRLTAAGWVRQPEGLGGLYEFAYDPREMSDEEVADVLRSRADELTGE